MYDSDAQKLAAKVIGTVESNLDYEAINYGDPITVGIAQWFGTRAAGILNRMRATSHWSGVAPTLNNQLQTIPQNESFWNTRELTIAEGDSVKPVLLACAAIQVDQLITDLEVYKGVAVANGMDPDANTAAMIFFFTMYHQGPVYALEVLDTVGPTADLDAFHAGALAHPVLGDYPTRYNDAYDLILAGDISDVDDPDTTPSDPVTGGGNGGANYTGNLAYIERVGNSLHLHYVDGQIQQAYTDGRGRYLPREGSAAPPATDTPPTPPAGTGEWTTPLPGGVLTSPYGPRPFDGVASFHYGLDLATPAGLAAGTIYAPADMVVTVAADNLNWTTGTVVKAHTTDGLYTFAFYHMQFASLTVGVGETVTKGSKIGIEGATGNVTGRHLHLEVYEGNIANPWPPPYGPTPIDPAPLFASKGVNF